MLSIEHWDDPSRVMRIDFQNENLVATEDGVVVVTRARPDQPCRREHRHRPADRGRRGGPASGDGGHAGGGLTQVERICGMSLRSPLERLVLELEARVASGKQLAGT
ncbi:MAG TPA: hypothetical protein VFE65_03015 [Pseudonocardia sp.]|nr:hypothetical protein [Pseudonocardia sp.]